MSRPRFLLLAALILVTLLTGCGGGGPEVGASVWTQEGLASFYASRYQGRATASGAPYDENAMTAAHRTLAFGTRVQVTHLNTGKQVEVEINDRGPFVEGRIIDLSREAARRLGILAEGLAPVRISKLD